MIRKKVKTKRELDVLRGWFEHAHGEEGLRVFNKALVYLGIVHIDERGRLIEPDCVKVCFYRRFRFSENDLTEKDDE